MKNIIAILFNLMLVVSYSQSDTLHYERIDSVYTNALLSEVIHYDMIGNIDTKILYIYKDNILLRREWWRKGIKISTVLN